MKVRIRRMLLDWNIVWNVIFIYQKHSIHIIEIVKYGIHSLSIHNIDDSMNICWWKNEISQSSKHMFLRSQFHLFHSTFCGIFLTDKITDELVTISTFWFAKCHLINETVQSIHFITNIDSKKLELWKPIKSSYIKYEKEFKSFLFICSFEWIE